MRWIKTALNFVSGSLPAQIALVALVAGLIVWGIVRQINNITDDARAGGNAEARAAAAEEGLTHVEDAKAAAVAVATDPAVRDAACLRHSRTPENC